MGKDHCDHTGGTVTKQEGNQMVTRCAEPWCGNALSWTPVEEKKK